MLRSSLFALALFGVAGCATNDATQTADRDCFFANQVNGYNVVDDRHVELRVGANKRYILTTDWNTRDLDWSHAIALRSSTGSICTGNGLGIDIFGGEPRHRYNVVEIERAPEPAAAAS